MKIAVIGTTGFVGKSITNELVNRGLEVLGISRSIIKSGKGNLTYIASDIYNVKELTEVIRRYDVVVNAFNPGLNSGNLYDKFMAGYKAIHDAVKQSGVQRYIVIGGAGCLYLEDGRQVMDTPGFPEEIKPMSKACADYLAFLKDENDLDWVFFSPAMEMNPHVTTGRTGKYRLGGDHPVFDENQKSILSVEDLAVVIADEIEYPKHHRTRFTAAY